MTLQLCQLPTLRNLQRRLIRPVLMAASWGILTTLILTTVGCLSADKSPQPMSTGTTRDTTTTQNPHPKPMSVSKSPTQKERTIDAPSRLSGSSGGSATVKLATLLQRLKNEPT
jgi:hypothetical protein